MSLIGSPLRQLDFCGCPLRHGIAPCFCGFPLPSSRSVQTQGPKGMLGFDQNDRIGFLSNGFVQLTVFMRSNTSTRALGV